MKIKTKGKLKSNKKIVITVLTVLVIAIFLLILFSNDVHAAGLVDDTVKIGTGNEYNKYSLGNYQLDFYVDTSWDWLPWNWVSDFGKSITYGVYVLTNALWVGSTYISSATGYLVQEAYKLNFITSTADSIGKNIQTIAGVSKSGFSSGGLYEGFSSFLILGVGFYVAYIGAIKRETTKAVHTIINFVLIFVLSMGFIAYAPDYIKNINGFSSDLSDACLSAGTKIILPQSNTKGKDSVDLIRDSLFAIQIKQPWVLLQFGNSDENTVGENRVKNLISTSPSIDNGKAREDVVKNEIEKENNANLTVTNVVSRCAMVLFIFAFNLGISVFVFFLSGIMIFSQVLFIVFAMFLPVSFLLSMIPGFENMAKKSIMRLFNIIMLRAGITLIITTAFSISSMLYSFSSTSPFFLVAFLQIVTFAGIYFKLNDLLGMFSIAGKEAHSFGQRFLQKHKSLTNKVRRLRHPFSKNKDRTSNNGKSGTRVSSAPSSSGRVSHSRPSSIGNRAGQSLGKIMDTKDNIKDTAGNFKERVKDLPDNMKYAVQHGKENLKDNVSDFKNGISDARKERQQLRKEKQDKYRENIASRRSEMSSEDIKHNNDNSNESKAETFKDKVKSRLRPNFVKNSGSKKSSNMQGKDSGENASVKGPENNTSSSSNKNIPGNVENKKSPIKPEKESRKNVSAKESGNNKSPLSKNTPGDMLNKKPPIKLEKEPRKNVSAKGPESNTSNSSRKSTPEDINIKKPSSMPGKDPRDNKVLKVPENISIKKPSSIPNKDMRRSVPKSNRNVSTAEKVSIEKTSSIKTNVVAADHRSNINNSAKMVSNMAKQNHNFVVKRIIDNKKLRSIPSLRKRKKK